MVSGIPSNTIFTNRAKVLGPFVRPKGNHLKWKLPNGVEKAVLGFDVSVNGITWKAPLPSRPEKILEWLSLAKLSLSLIHI